jgi:hypothetical protein
MNDAARALMAFYERPYACMFGAAVVLSAHGLFVAAHRFGNIPAAIAWLYVGIIDLLAVSAYRTWRRAGMAHWAGVVAVLTAVTTIALNGFSAFPAWAPVWLGFAVASFPPVAALLATALRLEEQRLHPATEDDASTEGVPEPVAPVEPQPEPQAERVEPVRLTAIPASTPPAPDERVAELVAAHVASGGDVADSALTEAVASELGVSPRTARRRLQPFRTEVAA